MKAAFIGIDWGTTHRRASVLDAQARVLAQHHDDEGALACAGRFRESLQSLLQRWPDLPPDVPVVMAGMVGSAIGWQEVPYLDASVPLAELPRHLAPVRDTPGRPWSIVPGLRWRGASGRIDVMRGEETQLLGALQLVAADARDGTYLLPGTHSKWLRWRGEQVASLCTYMSGELFALLRERGTLSAAMQAAAPEALDPAAFALGVEEAGDGPLSHALFGVRARVVTGALAPQAASSFVSGLLIGAEWHDRQLGIEGPVRIVGEAALARLHQRCAEQFGLQTEVLDVNAVQLAAWRALLEGMKR